jgi:hypothetical protein
MMIIPVLTPETKFIHFNLVSLNGFVAFKSRICISEKQSEIKNETKALDYNYTLMSSAIFSEKWSREFPDRTHVNIYIN